MKFETSWDDGGVYDERIVKLLTKHNLEKYSVFYIPLNAQIGLQWVKTISNFIEIGGHTVNHPQDLKLLEPEFVEFEVVHSKGLLESVIDKEITKFCYPRGRYDDFIVEKVKEAGWKEARTTEVLKTDEGDDPFRKPTTIHVFSRKEYNGEDWFDLAVRLFEGARKRNGYFHIWGHSIELQKNNEWDKLDKFFEYVKDKI